MSYTIIPDIRFPDRNADTEIAFQASPALIHWVTQSRRANLSTVPTAGTKLDPEKKLDLATIEASTIPLA